MGEREILALEVGEVAQHVRLGLMRVEDGLFEEGRGPAHVLRDARRQRLALAVDRRRVETERLGELDDRLGREVVVTLTARGDGDEDVEQIDDVLERN